VDTVVISTQHAEEISTEDLRKEILEKVIKQVIPKNLLDDRTIYHVWSTLPLAYKNELTDFTIFSDSTLRPLRYWRSPG
jgi:hypothetical protein